MHYSPKNMLDIFSVPQEEDKVASAEKENKDAYTEWKKAEYR